MDTRKDLYDTIILSGANTMFPGFSSRMQKDVVKLYKQNILKDENKEMKISIKIIVFDIIIQDTPRRFYSVFVGDCFLANFYENNNPKYWITKEEYEECGPQIIYQKCQNIVYEQSKLNKNKSFQ